MIGRLKNELSMKIVYVHDAIARIGGVERIFAEKMNYLADVFGYEVYLITTIQGNHPFSFHISSKVKHIDLDVCLHSQYQYPYPFRLWKKWEIDRTYEQKLNNEIQIIKPDIIIGTTCWKGDVVCNLKCSAKKIIESHGARSFTGINDGSKRNKLINWFYQNVLRKQQKNIENKCDVLVTLTKGDAEEWNKAKCVRVIPNMTQPLLQDSSTIIKKKKHVISVGRFEYQKGFDRLIKAWYIVNQKHPNWILDLYGCGSLQKEMEELIHTLHLDQSFILHNPTNFIHEKYLESEFYVLSSNYEGFALVLIEAMTCGISCVAFDCPYGPSDLIENYKNGILVKNGDIQGLADAICWMIEHEEERKRMGIAAKETSKKYAPEVIMKQWNELFKELVRK